MDERCFYTPASIKKHSTQLDSNSYTCIDSPPVNCSQAPCNIQMTYIPPSIPLSAERISPHYTSDTEIDLSTKICYLNSRLSKHTGFNALCMIMMIWSLLCLFLSMFSFSLEAKVANELLEMDQQWDNFAIVNFFVNLFHVCGYFYGIRTYNNQNSDMMANFEYIILAFTVSNFLYFLIYLIYQFINFAAFSVDLFFFLINLLLYFQAKEIEKLYKQKEDIRFKSLL